MGGLSSCCSTEPSENKETIKGSQGAAAEAPAPGSADNAEASMRYPRGLGKQEDGHREASGRPPSGAAPPAISEAVIAQFRKRLESSMEVIVLLADGSRLTCDLKLNPSSESLIISCDANLREIPLNELKAILHGKEQLRRVETKAALTDDPNCVALHMMTGNCIPLRFDTVDEKECFIELVKQLKTT